MRVPEQHRRDAGGRRVDIELRDLVQREEAQSADVDRLGHRKTRRPARLVDVAPHHE